MASDVTLANASKFLPLSKTNPLPNLGGDLETFAAASCPHAPATIAIMTAGAMSRLDPWLFAFRARFRICSSHPIPVENDPHAFLSRSGRRATTREALRLQAIPYRACLEAPRPSG